MHTTASSVQASCELFPRGSPLRRVAGESVMILGGQRALLLQIAHPLIAAGVADHSDFAEKPLRRLVTTADRVALIVWGSREDADRSVRTIRSRHDSVHGSLAQAAGTLSASTPYSAHDPHLQRWVWATLVDTADVVFQRYVRPYHPGERESVYDDWLRFAAFFGIPGSELPVTTQDFDSFYAAMLTGDELAVTPTARALADKILSPPLALVPRPAWRLPRYVTTALLPHRPRDAYGLSWGPCEQRQVAVFEAGVRAGLRLVPKIRRRLPEAYVATRHVFRSQGWSGPLPSVPE